MQSTVQYFLSNLFETQLVVQLENIEAAVEEHLRLHHQLHDEVV